MTYKYLPLNLVSLQFCSCGSDDPFTRSNPKDALFSDGTKIPLGLQRSVLAVQLKFAVAQTLDVPSTVCVRRKVAATLFDAATSRIVSTSAVTVSIRRRSGKCARRVYLPIKLDDIHFYHEYRLIVRDKELDCTLATRDILFTVATDTESDTDCHDDDDKTPHEADGTDWENLYDDPDEFDFDYLYEDDKPTADTHTHKDDAASADVVPLCFLTGLKNVKEKLATYEKVVRFNKMRRDNDLSSTMLPLHAMFLGSPGTGKTTVAKNIGQMLRRAGILSKGHVVERQRANLLGQNYSMEETNTLDAIKEAQGGILFIDEAYQLYQPADPRDPGRLVIETLMTALADESRRDWMLILAGYPDEMRRMFDMNPGLRSRIPDSNIYIFDDFTEGELMEIAENYLRRNNYRLSAEAQKALAHRFAVDYKQRDKQFGNARYVINIIQTEILPAMAARVVAEDSVSKETLQVIQASDIPAPSKRLNASRPCIGFHA